MKKGQFNLQLVYRETGEVFQEHTKEGGKTYAEVEPDAEYFVRVSSEASDAVYVDIQIDGTLIEKGRRVTRLKSEDIGIWRRDGGFLEENALKFNIADVKVKNGTRNQSFTFWTGVVTALFYGDPKHMITESDHREHSQSQHSETESTSSDTKTNDSPRESEVYASNNDESSENQYSECELSSYSPIYHPRENTVYTNNKDDVSGNVGFSKCDDDPKWEKGVKTVRGKTTLSRCRDRKPSPSPKRRKKKRAYVEDDFSWLELPHKRSPKQREKERFSEISYLEAPFLGSIELNYCSTIGLIHAEILPKPPGWRYLKLRTKFPRKDNWKELSEAKVEKISIEAVKRNGVTVQESKVVEFFDLSED